MVRKNLLGLALSVLLAANAAAVVKAADGVAGSAPAASAGEKSKLDSADAGGSSLAADADDDDGAKNIRGGSSKGLFESSKKILKAPTVPAKTAPCVSWLPEGKAKVAMLCIHGFSLHKGCYLAFGKEMAKEGIATYAIDLRGFGESKEKSDHTFLDFNGFLVDIKATLERIHQEQPGVPVIILGESMGGAVALRTAALYPDLVSGLIASVPARDRFGMSGDEAKVGFKAGLRTIFGGYSKPIDNAALGAVEKISEKEELRKQWTGSDPLMRTNFSAKEFIEFDEFMADNLSAAAMVKDSPVLFIQGTNDKLIRPAGTWRLFEHLSTPNRQMVLSKNSEHLIFEEAQFKPDDIRFVSTWIDRNVAHLDPTVASSTEKLPVVASAAEYNNASHVASAANANSTNSAKLGARTIAPDAGNVSADALVAQLSGASQPDSSATSSRTGSASTATTTTATATATETPDKTSTVASASVPSTEFKHRLSQSSPQINFWIELNRDGKTYRCNNKNEFKSGDKIRFHLIPETDGYAYLVMKAGTTGKSDVLFPNASYGTQNYLNHGKDYPIPAVGWMEFDQHPGTEQLGLVFANVKVDVTPETLKNRTMTAFVSHDQSGSKDLCPTRMKLSWDDPMPVVIPDDFSAISQVDNSSDSSLVRLAAANGGMISAAISLLHDSNR